MTYLLCRQRVLDFKEWKRVFDSHVEGHLEAGLVGGKILRNENDPNDVFVLFEVTDLQKARKFVTAPESPTPRGSPESSGGRTSSFWLDETAPYVRLT